MRAKSPLWFWYGIWALNLLAGLGLFLIYDRLPVDGATGNLESFTPEGFRVQWLLEERANGLQVGDIIVRVDGNTADEWLRGVSGSPEWRTGEVVTYEILRNGQPIELRLRLAPVPFSTILTRWTPQFVISLILIVIGSVVFWKRPYESAARVMMLFCMTVAVQLWVDAYNVQFAILPRRRLFWIHLLLEHGTFVLNYASICHFTLVFPAPHPLMERYPRRVLLALYLSNPLLMAVAMLLSPSWSRALPTGNQISMLVVLVQLGLTIGAGIRSIRTAHDPVSRAQVRWIFWGGSIALLVAIPGYVLPLALLGRPLIPHPAIMLLTVFIPLVYAVAILRYRLFDIEVIINRSLVYGTLTAFLGSLYLLLVRLLTLLAQGVLQRENDTLAVFVATLSIALAFAPLRQRVQTFIDYTFYRTKLDYQRLLPEMAERLATSIVLDELVALLTNELPQRLQIDWATLAVLDPSAGRFVLAAGGNGHPALPVDDPLVEYLHRLGRPLLRLQPSPGVPDEVQDFLDEHNIELSIPLIMGQELVGLYNLGPKLSSDAYNRDEMRLLYLLGQQASVAVENSRLFQALERQAQELAVLHEAAVAVSSSLEVEEVLRALAERLSHALDLCCAYICSLDQESAQSTVLAQWIGSEATDDASVLGMTFNVGRHPSLLQALLEGRSLAVRVSDPGLAPAGRQELERYGWKSCLIVPLVIRESVIGYAVLGETRREREFTAAEFRLCKTLAAESAAAIERARLFQAEREQRQLAEALDEAAAVVSGTLDLEQVLDRILERVERVVTGDAFNIMLIEGDRVRVVRWRGYERLGMADRIEGYSVLLGEYPTLAEMVRTQQPMVVPETAADPEWEVLKGWGWMRSHVSAPIRITGRMVGFLNVDGTRAGQFGTAEAQRLEAFAHHAAIALENARLYRQAQQEIAERMRAEERIKASLEEKEVLLKEIHHRVKNNLQVISSLLYLQSRNIEDKQTLQMFRDSQNRVRSMALVHERLYQSEDLARIDFVEYVRNLANYLIRSYGADANLVKLRVSVDDVLLDVDAALRCGLIINELVSNSLKHAFPDSRQGEILIEFHSDDDRQFMLVVSDNGVGLAQDFDFRDAGSLGLQLVQNLVDQLGGTVELDSKGGVTYSITFSAPSTESES
jgi:two-component sensor histidine kinase